MEDADKVSGSIVDWDDLLQEINLGKPVNDTPTALDILFRDFYLEDEENSIEQTLYQVSWCKERRCHPVRSMSLGMTLLELEERIRSF